MKRIAFIAPLVLAKPMSEQWGMAVVTAARFEERRSLPVVTMLAAVAMVIGAWVTTTTFVAQHEFKFLPAFWPAAAVDVLQQHKAQRVFNTAPFGGYLVSRDIKVFIDGRAELYGEQFVLDYYAALDARDTGQLLDLLDRYRIDATLLSSGSPAGNVLDHLKGWKRLYKDDVAVIHVRSDDKAAAAPAAGSSN